MWGKEGTATSRVRLTLGRRMREMEYARGLETCGFHSGEEGPPGRGREAESESAGARYKRRAMSGSGAL